MLLNKKIASAVILLTIFTLNMQAMLAKITVDKNGGLTLKIAGFNSILIMQGKSKYQLHADELGFIFNAPAIAKIAFEMPACVPGSETYWRFNAQNKQELEASTKLDFDLVGSKKLKELQKPLNSKKEQKDCLIK